MGHKPSELGCIAIMITNCGECQSNKRHFPNYVRWTGGQTLPGRLILPPSAVQIDDDTALDLTLQDVCPQLRQIR